jgi:flagellin
MQMPQIINTNVMSLNSQRNLNKSQAGLATALNRLSSGLRINSAKDDAAGLAISERFTAQIRGLSQASRNANDGISLAQTAEGALNEVSNMLQRMRELSVQSANATNSASDRTALQKEVIQLQNEVSRIAGATSFNGSKLLDGSFTGKSIQVGSNANDTISVNMVSMDTTSIGSYKLSSENINTALSTPLNTGIVNNNTAEVLTVTGNLGSSNVTVNAGDSGYDVVTAVNNATADTGVSASAFTKGRMQGFSTAGTVTFDLHGKNSTGVAISATMTSTTDYQALADAINDAESSTGISATVTTAGIELTQAEGYDIAIENYGNTGAVGATYTFAGFYGDSDTATSTASVLVTEGAADDAVIGAKVDFRSSKGFTVIGDATEMFTAATNGATLQKVSAVDITTRDGANNAMSTLDGALDAVSAIRSQLGALQSRFESTISNLQTSVENLSAARSRIQDADFAAETAELTRTQILQQAGTAMLAQANSIPQNVLSLLG